MNKNLDTYFTDGCGRCKHYQTPECKVLTWSRELEQLKRIIDETGLEPAMKWGSPTYMHQGKNILMLTAFRDFAVISFFKGVLLKDDLKLLEFAGDNSYISKWMKFDNVQKVLNIEQTIKAYIYEAVEIEKSGLQVDKKSSEKENIPKELYELFGQNTEFESAFFALTPGRQRGYLLYFNQAKQADTRRSRIIKSIPNILKGLGFHDR